MDDPVLANLVRRAQAKDADAFDELIELFGRRMYGYFYRFVASREEAEDLLQELFLRVVRSIDRYAHGQQFEAWLFRIATNLLRDRARGIKRRPTPGVLDGDTEEQPPAGCAEIGRSPETQDEVDRLGAALQRLSEPERQVVMLRHFSQLSFAEIAAIVSAPVGTVLARAHRALAKLREIMETTG